MKAIWNNEVIAETNQILEIEGTHYFPQDAVKHEYLSSSDYCEECAWKGLAKYYHLEVSGKDLLNAVWYYPNPKEEAIQVGHFQTVATGIHFQGDGKRLVVGIATPLLNDILLAVIQVPGCTKVVIRCQAQGNREGYFNRLAEIGLGKVVF